MVVKGYGGGNEGVLGGYQCQVSVSVDYLVVREMDLTWSACFELAKQCNISVGLVHGMVSYYYWNARWICLYSTFLYAMLMTSMVVQYKRTADSAEVSRKFAVNSL